jgi:hypothetical protein
VSKSELAGLVNEMAQRVRLEKELKKFGETAKAGQVGTQHIASKQQIIEIDLFVSPINNGIDQCLLGFAQLD